MRANEKQMRVEIDHFLFILFMLQQCGNCLIIAFLSDVMNQYMPQTMTDLIMLFELGPVFGTSLWLVI